MPFIANITQFKSLAIVGTARGVDKAESLSYILGALRERCPELQLALTSIGVDGKLRDQMTQTDRPEITLHERICFVTAENLSRKKLLPAEIFDIDHIYSSSIGQLIYVRARDIGRMLITGSPSTGGLCRIVTRVKQEGVGLTLIDGALSRFSLTPPSVAEGVMLTTDSVYLAQPEQLIKRVRELMRLIRLPQLTDRKLAEQLAGVDKGVRLLTDEGAVVDPGFASALTPDMWRDTTRPAEGDTLYIPGVASGKLLSQLRLTKRHRQLVVKDFTCIFVSGQAVQSHLTTGRRMKTLYSNKLMTVTFNPLASSGYRLGSEHICEQLSETLEVPVYDVRRL